MKRGKKKLSLSLSRFMVGRTSITVSPGHRRERDVERRRVKETVSRTLLPASLCAAGARTQKEKKAGEKGGVGRLRRA